MVESQAERVRRIASSELGPRTASAMRGESVLERVRARTERGRTLEDAVLGVAFEVAREEPGVADEFFDALVRELSSRPGRSKLRPAARRLLDSADLRQSVLGDVWKALGELRFETWPQFVALVVQRIEWKARDHQNRLERGKRREDRRVDAAVEDLDPPSDQRSPASEAMSADEAARVAAAIARLGDRDRQIVRMHLAREPTSAIALAIGLELESARKALQRAIARLRERLEDPAAR